MLSAVFVITIILYGNTKQVFRIPVPTHAQCEMMKNTPGAWWTLRDAEVECKTEIPI